MNNPSPAYYETLAAARGVKPAPARSWAILLTSANHGVVGPLGSTFPHAGEHHERVVVVEVPAGAGAPSDEVNLALRAAPAAEASAGNVPTDERAAFERHERGSNLRRVGVDRDGSAGWYENPCVQSAWEGWQARAAVAAQAGQVAVPVNRQELAGRVLAAGYRLAGAEHLSARNSGKGGPGLEGSVARAEKAFADAVDALAAAPSAPAVAQQAPAQAEPGWISVDERLPEFRHECTSSGCEVSDSLMVYGQNEFGTTGCGFGHARDDGTWATYEAEYDQLTVVKVTHWMPLPSAPAQASTAGERQEGGA